MVRPQKFEIRQERDGSSLRVALRGELDMASVPALRDALKAEAERGFDLLTLDLGGLGFMDSTGVRFLIELNDHAGPWELRLVAPRDREAALVLEMTGVAAALPFIKGDAR